MAKRIWQAALYSMALVFVFAGTCVAAGQTSIALIVKTDRFVMSEEVKKQFDKDMAALFPKAGYKVVEDKAVADDFSKRIDGKLLKDPAAITQDTLFDLARKYNYDCVIFLFYKLNHASNNSNFINWRKKAQMTLFVQMVHKESGKIVYENKITREGRKPIKTARDLSDINAIASESAKRCNEHLFSPLELQYAKRVLDLL